MSIYGQLTDLISMVVNNKEFGQEESITFMPMNVGIHIHSWSKSMRLPVGAVVLEPWTLDLP